jgi:hypothetical protein
MPQRDYILRMIEQIGAVLAGIRKRLLGGKASEETRQELTDVASQAGFDLELVRGFDLDTLLMLIAPAGEIEPARGWLMAEVLYLDGLDATLTGGPAHDSLVKARALFELMRPHPALFVGIAEADHRIAEIDALLDAALE